MTENPYVKESKDGVVSVRHGAWDRGYNQAIDDVVVLMPDYLEFEDVKALRKKVIE